MKIVKVLLAGLFGGTLCMANIGGIVTDTGTTPIAGAVVQLEKGGQTAITGSDGRFSLVTNTSILNGSNKLLSKSFTAKIIL